MTGEWVGWIGCDGWFFLLLRIGKSQSKDIIDPRKSEIMPSRINIGYGVFLRIKNYLVNNFQVKIRVAKDLKANLNQPTQDNSN